jgi:hypothetical protein
LPPQLQRDLPTVEELAPEFPLMSVVKLRIEIERTLRDFMIDNGGTPERPAGITEMVSALQKRRVAPASTKPFLASLRVMLEASHGVDVDGTSAQRAIDVGTTFLAELRELRAHSGKDG